MQTQIHAKTYESHSPMFSKINAFAMNSSFGYFLLSFQCFIYPFYWNPSLTIIWKLFHYPLIKKCNYLEPMAVTECQKNLVNVFV